MHTEVRDLKIKVHTWDTYEMLRFDCRLGPGYLKLWMAVSIFNFQNQYEAGYLTSGVNYLHTYFSKNWNQQELSTLSRWALLPVVQGSSPASAINAARAETIWLDVKEASKVEKSIHPTSNPSLPQLSGIGTFPATSSLCLFSLSRPDNTTFVSGCSFIFQRLVVFSEKHVFLWEDPGEIGSLDSPGKGKWVLSILQFFFVSVWNLREEILQRNIRNENKGK